MSYFKDLTTRLRRSREQEQRIARALIGGRRVAGSGSMPSMKGDVRATLWLVEAKQTRTSRYNLTLAVWRKIEREAMRASKEPALMIDMAGRNLVVISEATFLALQDAVR